ncbi:uncharacterized protein LOC111261183 isoform X2 [Varroa jacobsoni]|uniref:ERCC4 domain-containing protein n=1 Tax=Varroa destructor TaxID=109461 RepID=A0A7M7KNA7_VARDE|nr:uncharacterized protein LOC111253041 isoform X2 [Varroa destructor]XP_022690215.1 uncharacterized protein LOC111261183 isoform X2 [Varroa jacobsoni]
MSQRNTEEKNAMGFPDLSIVFSRSLTDQPWFAPLKIMIDVSNLCEITIEDTFPELICWKSTSIEFVEDQVVLIYRLEEFAVRIRRLEDEIASWPEKYGRKFVTIVIMLEGKEKISAEMDRRIILAQATAKKFNSRLRDEVLGFEENRRTASNPAEVWPGMLEMFFNHASFQLARAIATRFPSPRALRHELLRRPAVEVFEGITATVGEPPLQRTFRIGPETANRLYNFFTQDDPNALV